MTSSQNHEPSPISPLALRRTRSKPTNQIFPPQTSGQSCPLHPSGCARNGGGRRRARTEADDGRGVGYCLGRRTTTRCTYIRRAAKKRRRAGTRALLHIRALDGRGQPGGGKTPSSFRSFCGLSTTTAVFRITGFVRRVFAGHNIHTSERGRGAVDRFSLETRTPRRGAP